MTTRLFASSLRLGGLTAALAVGISMAAVSSASLAQSAGDYAITILHTNDLHSRLLPVNRFNSTCTAKEETEKACFGGVARIATKTAEIRSQVKAAGGNLLWLDAGDQFQGSLFYTTYKGQAELKTMNMLDYDVMALGNHEFDNGPPVLADFLKGTKFPVLSANLNSTREPRLQGLYRPYTILERGGQRIGIIGITTSDTPITSSPGDTVSFEDEQKVLTTYVRELQQAGVTKVIALTHVGVEKDKQIAANVPGIDVIVGGHSHTLLSNTAKDTEGPYPIVVKNKGGHNTLIVQAYAYSKYLGRLDVSFNAKGEVSKWGGDTILLDASVAEDATVKAEVAKLDAPIQELKAKPVGSSKIALDGDAKNCRQRECIMGNLVSDAMLAATAASGTQIAIQNGGGLRASIDQGEVTLGEVLTVLPFQNAIATMKLTGADIVAALENGVSKVEEGQGRFPQVSGLRFTWDRKKPAGQRVVSVEVKGANGAFAPIDPNAMYKVVTNDFMRRGGDGYAMFKEKAVDPYDFGPNLEEAVSAYIAKGSPVEPKLEGRIREAQ